jgi:hypothetical protein
VGVRGPCEVEELRELGALGSPHGFPCIMDVKSEGDGEVTWKLRLCFEWKSTP